ncbi:putative phage abortive infection protein [Bacillus sp. NMTD17]|uniref:putative phage abortive infection protein n=1 Tax=Bacillus sp. NMTD17 TaxID=2108547 RepID=UPI000D040D67|nr:putative phage abortive infection protein [Bacillus sp. NMTD17]PRS67556.1 hypothetical protein C6347_15845 [Bacillus sp. NMTD17]
MKEWFKENKWIFVGGIVIVAAILTPLILFIVRNHLDQKTFEALGPVGDFFGGTTVGLLTLASMLFVIASISMQRKQLNMQQDELKMQREELAKTREEFELTNKTLTKQQFESTFFNMINLHHNLLKDLEEGRSYFNETYKLLESEYKITVKEYWGNNLIYLENHEPDKLKHLLRAFCLNNWKVNHLEHLLQETRYSEFMENNLFKEIESQNEQYYISTIENFKAKFEERSIDYWITTCIDDTNVLDYFLGINSMRLSFSNINGLKYLISNISFFESFDDEWTIEYIKQIRKETFLNPLLPLKRLVYEKVYDLKEEQIGHYYRNLYRIVRFIQDEHFSTDQEENENEKKKYRGILRAQLSSMELLMLFYNVVYSKKGEKFREILKGTNFFDDHIIESKFLWANDKEELAALK